MHNGKITSAMLDAETGLLFCPLSPFCLLSAFRSFPCIYTLFNVSLVFRIVLVP